MDTTSTAGPTATTPRKTKRRMRSNAEKREIVEATLMEGASVAAVARHYDMNANQLFGWRRLYEQGRLDRCREPASSRLLPVQVMPALSASEAARAPAATARVEIALPDGVVVRVDSTVDPFRLATLLAAVQSR